MKNLKVMNGSTPAPKKIHIRVTNDGPYLVYGAPPLFQQFIMVDKLGESIYYQTGKEFSTADEPTALCRCGASTNSPYCNGAHHTADWNPELTAPNESLLTSANIIEGEDLTLLDNERYCVYARFCHPGGGTWHLTEESGDAESREMAIRQSLLCPGGRLTAWAKDADEPFEEESEPNLGLLEDSTIGVSSGIWVRGGIAIEKEDGELYEIRNRVVLCRCGNSRNKPYCDASHVSSQWHDAIEDEVGVEEKVEVGAI